MTENNTIERRKPSRQYSMPSSEIRREAPFQRFQSFQAFHEIAECALEKTVQTHSER
jgi:hypothetical protein